MRTSVPVAPKSVPQGVKQDLAKAVASGFVRKAGPRTTPRALAAALLTGVPTKPF